MNPHGQLTIDMSAMTLAAPERDPGFTYGEVFTRRWVVELILDLAGYTADRDLGGRRLVEPSCGTGAFLVPAVERLIQSCATHGRDLREMDAAVRAYDLLEANTQRARKELLDVLVRGGLLEHEACELVNRWVTTADFLLYDHEPDSADFVVGNPPYLRLEHVAKPVMDAYRRVCPTMRGRADIYVGFFERGLQLLKPGGSLGYICADRWMRNQYGSHLRAEITRTAAIDAVITMHDVDAFEDDVAAYPAIVVLGRHKQGSAVVARAGAGFSAVDAQRLATWSHGRGHSRATKSFSAHRVAGWSGGTVPWPSGSPAGLTLVASLEGRFPPLQDARTGTRVGIGVATGCDDLLITSDPDLVESDRLLPLLRAHDIASGDVLWSGRSLVNPWDRNGLVDLDDYPRLRAYLEEHEVRLRRRHVAMRRPRDWYRTIDRVDDALAARPKLLLPDMKSASHPVLDEGGFYPHHNLYHVTSVEWDLEVLGGLLLSDIANLFVGAYCVRMRGGTYRFQAQYIRRIRVPAVTDVPRSAKRELMLAFRTRDRGWANRVATRLYDLDGDQLAAAMRH